MGVDGHARRVFRATRHLEIEQYLRAPDAPLREHPDSRLKWFDDLRVYAESAASLEDLLYWVASVCNWFGQPEARVVDALMRLLPMYMRDDILDW